MSTKERFTNYVLGYIGSLANAVDGVLVCF